MEFAFTQTQLYKNIGAYLLNCGVLSIKYWMPVMEKCYRIPVFLGYDEMQAAIYNPLPVFDLWLTVLVDYFTFQTHMIFHLKN